MIVKTYEVEKIKNTNLNFFLLYGENEGFKNQIIKNFLSADYKENIIRYDENEIISKTDLLAAEITNKSFFSDKKIIIISRATDKVNKILEDYLDKSFNDIRIVINAGILDKRSKLRNIFEKKKNLICMPFYADDNLALTKLASHFFKEKKISISRETINLLVERCRGNRQNLDNELSKIENFSKNKINLSIEDIARLTNLAENYSYSELSDQCLLKNSRKTISILNENNYAKEDCIAITKVMILKTKRLIKLKENNQIEKNIDTVISMFKPPIFWKEKEIVKLQMQNWSLKLISDMLNELNDLELILKKNNENSVNILNDFILSKVSSSN